MKDTAGGATNMEPKRKRKNSQADYNTWDENNMDEYKKNHKSRTTTRGPYVNSNAYIGWE